MGFCVFEAYLVAVVPIELIREKRLANAPLHTAHA
jgi:hypothetical protein